MVEPLAYTSDGPLVCLAIVTDRAVRLKSKGWKKVQKVVQPVRRIGSLVPEFWKKLDLVRVYGNLVLAKGEGKSIIATRWRYVLACLSGDNCALVFRGSKQGQLF